MEQPVREVKMASMRVCVWGGGGGGGKIYMSAAMYSLKFS